jgi:hypothetical protein
MTQFRNGEGQQGSGSGGCRKRSSSREEGEFGSNPFLGTHAGQKGISQHHQRHMYVIRNSTHPADGPRGRQDLSLPLGGGDGKQASSDASNGAGRWKQTEKSYSE